MAEPAKPSTPWSPELWSRTRWGCCAPKTAMSMRSFSPLGPGASSPRVCSRPPRSVESAEYSIRWIDQLREMAEAWPGWRSPAERDHVFAQFDEARAIYERFAAEAGR